MPNNPPVEQLMPSDYTNSSVSHVSPNPNSYIYRIRSRLLILLGIMFVSDFESHIIFINILFFKGLSFSYLLFLGISCIPGFYPWLCEYFNKRYEFAWACVSLIFDGFWILLTYQYHVRGLRIVSSPIRSSFNLSVLLLLLSHLVRLVWFDVPGNFCHFLGCCSFTFLPHSYGVKSFCY